MMPRSRILTVFLAVLCPAILAVAPPSPHCRDRRRSCAGVRSSRFAEDRVDRRRPEVDRRIRRFGQTGDPWIAGGCPLVLQLMMALESQAASAGGRAIAAPETTRS